MKLKYKYSKLYWVVKQFSWLKVYFSPFKTPTTRIYLGKTAIGVPWFLPRRWRKVTTAEAIIRATKSLNKDKKGIRTFEQWLEHHKKYTTAVPKIIGFDFRDLGWKTKWEHDDYRYEYSPVWSFVAFGYQLAVTFTAEYDNHYWECFLAYIRETDKKLSVKDRLKDCIKRYPCKWTSHSLDREFTTDYWQLVLKDKYNKLLF